MRKVSLAPSLPRLYHTHPHPSFAPSLTLHLSRAAFRYPGHYHMLFVHLRLFSLSPSRPLLLLSLTMFNAYKDTCVCVYVCKSSQLMPFVTLMFYALCYLGKGTYVKVQCARLYVCVCVQGGGGVRALQLKTKPFNLTWDCQEQPSRINLLLLILPITFFLPFFTIHKFVFLHVHAISPLLIPLLFPPLFPSLLLTWLASPQFFLLLNTHIIRYIVWM